MDVAGDPPGIRPADLMPGMPDLDREQVLGPKPQLDRPAGEGRVDLVLVALERHRGGPADPPLGRPEEGGPQDIGVRVAPLDLAVPGERRLAGLRVDTAERHRRVVIVIDEAHLLSPEQLEELRLLTNSDMDSRSPFAGILLGQPSLARQLRLGVFAALDQRIAVRYQISPMDLGDSAAYLRHHLALAGRSDQLFADDAIARLHRLSGGIPRALNNAAVAALIAAASDGKELVDDACAKKAVTELTREQ